MLIIWSIQLGELLIGMTFREAGVRELNSPA